MSFWTYMLRCRGGYFYVGHTDDIDRRIGEHKSGLIPGFTADHQPVELVWSDRFEKRDDAKAAERKLKGWSRAKKLALIRGDWERISALAKKKDSASTSSAKTGMGEEEIGRVELPNFNPEFVKGQHFSLQPHPDTPPVEVGAVEVELAEGDYHELFAVFTVRHSKGAIRIPEPVQYASRHDGLWEATCFEVFVMRSHSSGYYEFNFSPSNAWAAYEFDSYRSKQGDLAIDPPYFVVDLHEDRIAVTVLVDPDALGDLDKRCAWRVGLSAVIEETDGTKSYWALAHPPGKPDFHHPTCFAATLPPPERS